MSRKNRLFAKLANTVNSNGKLQESSLAADLDLGGGATTVYATANLLPRTGIDAGATAFVTETSRFYIWNGVGWFNVAVVNNTPTITNAPSATYNLYANGSPTIITLAATDPDGDTLTWSYSAPDAVGKATITQADNVFTITPLTDIADTSFTIDFEVTDGINISTASSTVNIDNRSPVIDTASAATYALATDGSPTVITLAATDPDGGSITWTYADSGLTDQATVVQNGNEFTITPNSTPAVYADFTLTFTASDSIESTSTSPTTLSLTFVLVADQWSDTVLSLGTSSTDGLANQTFIDRSTNANAGAVNTWGTSFSQTASHPYLDNWSVEFDGSGDYLTVGASNDFEFTADYTIEFWAYVKGTGDRFYLDNDDNSIFVRIRSDQWQAVIEGVATYFGSSIQNGWNHVALQRSGTTVTGYVNGVGTTITTSSSSTVTGNRTLTIGAQNTSTGGITGNLSNLRIVKGTAIYSGNFTPPTEKLTAVSGTTLLTCQSNRFIDNSASAHSITVNGNPKVSAFNPFGQESEYVPGENKGSVSFTTTDGIDLRIRPFGTTQTWTMELWYKFNPNSTINANHYLFDNRQVTGGQIGGDLYLYRNGSYTDGGSYEMNDDNFNDGSWHHFTMVCDGINRAIWVDGTRVGTAAGSKKFGTHVWLNSRYSDQYHHDCEYSDFRFSSIARYNPVHSSTATIPVPTSPVGTDSNTAAYYPFDNAGVFDKTGNNLIDLANTGSTSTSVTKYSDSSLRTSGSYAIAELPFALGLKDFTIEWWQRTDNNTNDSLVTLGISTANGGQETGWHFGFTPTVYRFWSGGSYSFTGGSITASTFVSGVWNHIAICRENGVYYGYINGNYFGSLTGLSAVSLAASEIKIGGYVSANGASFSRFPPGNVEDLQLVLGRKYTQSFTPPGAPQGRTYQAES